MRGEKRFFFSCNSTWPFLNYKVLLVHVCWWRKLYHVSTFSLYWFILLTKYNKLNALILVLLNKEVLFASFVQHFLMVFLHWANKNTFVKKWSEFIEIYKKILLFTFGSIKSTNAWVGLRKCLKQIIWIKHNGVKIPNWREANHWPFSKVVEDLTNLGLATVNKSS